MSLTLTGAGSSGPGGAPPFNPSDIPNLLLDLQPSPTYCFSDAAGTVPCGNGDLIYLWKDQSGNAIDYVQATAGKRFTLTLVGGLYVARAGAGTGMSQVLGTTNPNPPSTIISAERITTNGAGRRTYCNTIAGNALVSPSRNDGFGFYYEAQISTSFAAVGRHTGAMVAPAVGNFIAYIDGVDVTTAPVAAASWIVLALGVDGLNGEAPMTDIVRLTWYQRVLSAAELLTYSNWANAL